MSYQEKQNQHRISQVYLREFGFLEETRWKIYSVNPPKYDIQLHCIDKFSAEINLFDLPLNDPIEIRHYENNFAIIEGHYPKIHKCIENQKRLVYPMRDYLNHFISTLIGRSEIYENIIEGIMNNERLIPGFIEEILLGEKEENIEKSKNTYEKAIPNLSGRFRFNVVLGSIINSLTHRLRHCELIILKSASNLEWITSDNPVYINPNDNYSLLITIDSEIYFPISRTYLAFLFHKDSNESSNPIRHLNKNRINEIGDDLFFEIISKLSNNKKDFVLFGKDHILMKYLESNIS